MNVYSTLTHIFMESLPRSEWVHWIRQLDNWGGRNNNRSIPFKESVVIRSELANAMQVKYRVDSEQVELDQIGEELTTSQRIQSALYRHAVDSIDWVELAQVVISRYVANQFPMSL